MAAAKIPYLKNNDGTKIPVLGLGTYQALGNDCENAVRDAIDAGYCLIDTAYYYHNEYEVGKAVRDKIAEGVVKREDIYIVSKLWNNFHEPEKVERACCKTLGNLGMDYIDLYLIHWPFGFVYNSDEDGLPKKDNGQFDMIDVDYLDTWRAMERLVEMGMTKSIGVSNFNSEQLSRLLCNSKIKPVVNQVECHPGFNQLSLIAFCKQRDVNVMAYRPLDRPNLTEKTPKYFFDSVVQEIAEKHKKTTAQIALRFLLELGVIPIPKAINKTHIIENFNLFDFKLSEGERKIMHGFHTENRSVLMESAKGHQYYPFDIAF